MTNNNANGIPPSTYEPLVGPGPVGWPFPILNSILEGRQAPQQVHMGISSQTASAGQTGRMHIW